VRSGGEDTHSNGEERTGESAQGHSVENTGNGNAYTRMAMEKHGDHGLGQGIVTNARE